MKRKMWIIVGCLALCLTGCGKQPLTYAESCWESISYSTKLDEYVAENAGGLDVEALKSEAGDAESTLSQQYMATALLCATEYGEGQYSVSSPYADAFLAKVLTEEENFWKTLEEVSNFDIFFRPMLDAAKELDGELLVKLVQGIPEDSSYKYGLQKELDSWIEENPVKLLETGDELIASGYFDDWISSQWSTVFFYNEPQVDSMADAVKYMVYLRDTILPLAQAGANPTLYVGPSSLTGEDYLSTELMVAIGEGITLQEPGNEDLSEEIVTEGKKVVALYRNLQEAEFPYSPKPLRLIGDFMLNLPGQECPASIEEADYYLVLTPAYEYGDYYYYDNGEASDVREVHSTTSVDLYEAGTGKFLRHLGNVLEDSARGIFSSGSDNAPRYPEEVNADILYYIYSHVNDPDAYAFLVDHIGDKAEFEKEETVLIGPWEITYHNSEIVDAFETNLSKYTADAGNQFIKAEFTLTNRGNQKDTFITATFDGWEDVAIYMIDFANETYYDCINQEISNFGLFGKDSMEPGESQTGELVFQVPDGAAQQTDALYLAISKGWQVLICPLGE